MDKLSEAKDILKRIGMPTQQQNDISAYALLTLAGILPGSDWKVATNHWIRIHDILSFMYKYYGKEYAENTRETIRKNCMHQFRDAALIEDNGMATNSPNYMYRITAEALFVLQSYGTGNFVYNVEAYHLQHERLIEKYSSKKKMQMMPISINGKELRFSPGKHNELQRAILEEFAPRFAPYSECLYVGDTAEKSLLMNNEKLFYLGFEITVHDKMPDIILYRPDVDWLFFIEAVTSTGPISHKRLLEIMNMTKNTKSGRIFVTTFLDTATYKKFFNDIAWDTEIWIAETPEHMIHLNGNKFLEPR